MNNPPLSSHVICGKHFTFVLLTGSCYARSNFCQSTKCLNTTHEAILHHMLGKQNSLCVPWRNTNFQSIIETTHFYPSKIGRNLFKWHVAECPDKAMLDRCVLNDISMSLWSTQPGTSHCTNWQAHIYTTGWTGAMQDEQNCWSSEWLLHGFILCHLSWDQSFTHCAYTPHKETRFS